MDTDEDFLITSYYLWLPYLLSFLFAMAKMPHSVWKRYFENNLLSSILGMMESFNNTGAILILFCITGGMAGSDVKDQAEEQQQGGQEGGEEEDGEGEAKETGENKGKKKQENNNGGGKKNKNNNNNKNQKQAARSPVIMARSFVHLRGESRYNRYQFNFLMLEATNLLTLLAQLLVRIIALEISHVEMKCLR